MRTLLPITLLLLAPTLGAQDSRPTSQPQPEVKARNGGFFGIRLAEEVTDAGSVVAIGSVVTGSDAERLGFRRGDHITAVNEIRVEDGDHFIRLIYGTLDDKVGEQARQWVGMKTPTDGSHFTVLRQGKEVRIKCGLADLDANPKVGQHAPDFTLSGSDGDAKTTLSQLIGPKPIVLIFGSYT